MIEKSGMDEDLRWRQRLDSYRRARRQLQAAVDLGRQRTLSELEQQGLIPSVRIHPRAGLEPHERLFALARKQYADRFARLDARCVRRRTN